MGENNRFCSLRKRKDLDKIAQSNSVRLCISSFLCGPKPIYGHINNGNWTEWSEIWSEIIRVISKSNERTARVRFEITNMISDQNCTTRSSITTLLQPFWNHRIQSVLKLYFIDQEAGLLKSRNKKAFTSHFVFETEMMRYGTKMVRFKTEMMRFRTWLTRFGADAI